MGTNPNGAATSHARQHTTTQATTNILSRITRLLHQPAEYGPYGAESEDHAPNDEDLTLGDARKLHLGSLGDPDDERFVSRELVHGVLLGCELRERDDGNSYHHKDEDSDTREAAD